MADPSLYTYPSPLEGYEKAEPLPDEKNEDGKSYVNPQTGVLSTAYETFVDPIAKDRRGGFDVHIYYYQYNEGQKTFALALWERIRRECPLSSLSEPQSNHKPLRLHEEINRCIYLQFPNSVSTAFGTGQ
ncbi:MAG: hypothetical protein M1819_002317 [Sarea resinae]|nr:MAG: hypothetical protein M1819_002317 [Sarea resinae]